MNKLVNDGMVVIEDLFDLIVNLSIFLSNFMATNGKRRNDVYAMSE